MKSAIKEEVKISINESLVASKKRHVKQPADALAPKDGQELNIKNMLDGPSPSCGHHVFTNVLDPEELKEENHRVIDESDTSFELLKDSILIAGVREPIQLYYSRDGKSISIMAGHRRRRAVMALRRMGITVPLPATLLVPSEEGESPSEALARASSAAVTNMSSLRKDLRGVERAKAIADFMKTSRISSISDAAKALGADRKTIERSLALLDLSERLQNLLIEHSGLIKERDMIEISQQHRRNLHDDSDLAEANTEAFIKDIINKYRDNHKDVVKPSKAKQVIKVSESQIRQKLTKAKVPDDQVSKIIDVIFR